MTAYYNEIEPYAAEWLRNLIKEGLIAHGEVDTRSIVDVRPGDLVGFDQCHFFAGLGGWSGALRLAGVPDTEPLWTGSCPCQPFSLAGKQKGFDDERHLWPVWSELISVRRPAKVFGEQVAAASAWLGVVRGDLEAMDYAVGAIPCEAASAGADHLRDRFWFVANSQEKRRPDRNAGTIQGSAIGQWAPEQPEQCGRDGGALLADADCAAIRIEPGRGSGPCGPRAGIDRDDSEIRLADANELGTGGRRKQRSRQQRGTGRDPEAFAWVIGADGKARRVKSGVRLLAHGVPARVAKLRAFGNAIDLRPAAAFIQAAIGATQ